MYRICGYIPKFMHHLPINYARALRVKIKICQVNPEEKIPKQSIYLQTPVSVNYMALENYLDYFSIY